MSKTITHHDYPPIPDRRWDWSAHIGGDEEGPTGHGRTEAEAVADLADQLQDEIYSRLQGGSR